VEKCGLTYIREEGSARRAKEFHHVNLVFNTSKAAEAYDPETDDALAAAEEYVSTDDMVYAEEKDEHHQEVDELFQGKNSLVAELEEETVDVWKEEHWAEESGGGALTEINERMADKPDFEAIFLAEIESVE